MDPLGAQTTLAYDGNSNLTSVLDALNHGTGFTYDEFDRVASRTDPLLRGETYLYDGQSNLTTNSDRKGQVTARQYDALDRPSLATFEDGSTITFTYDAGDRLVQIVDTASGTIVRDYDSFDRVTLETTPEGAVSYTYDTDGRRATITVGGQSTVSYTYDQADRLTSIVQDSDAVTLGYDDADRRVAVTYANGVVAKYGYDAANQLNRVAYTLGSTLLGDLTYSYDAAGQRIGVGGTWARTGVPATLAAATYDAANQTLSWDGSTFSCDPNGNLTNDGTKTYSWNARNQLASLSGGTSASFAYDAFGRRRGKTISGTTTNFLHDGPNVVQELTSGGTPTANLLTGLKVDELFARADTNGTSTLLTDALGSTVELADASGTLQTHYTYEPFGATTIAGATSTNTQQFTAARMTRQVCTSTAPATTVRKVNGSLAKTHRVWPVV